MKTILGVRWWVVALIVSASIAIGVLAARAAQRPATESPQLVLVSAQPAYDAEGKLIAFPVTLRFKITEKKMDGTPPKSFFQTVEYDLVQQEKHTMALDGETVELGSIRDDLIEVAGALYRLQNPPPLPRMTRKAIRGDPK